VFGRTPLGWTKNGQVVKVLIEADASVNARDFNGQTALHLAVIGGLTQLEEFLLENGANTNIRDISGLTAADYSQAHPVPPTKTTTISAQKSTEKPQQQQPQQQPQQQQPKAKQQPQQQPKSNQQQPKANQQLPKVVPQPAKVKHKKKYNGWATYFASLYT